MLQSMPGIGEMALNAQRLHNRLSAQIPEVTQYLPWACINYFVLLWYKQIFEGYNLELFDLGS